MQPAPVLHLVCFDLPIPPLYGGTEEVDAKIRVLLDMGVALHVHAFVWPKAMRSGKLPDWHQRVASLRCYPRKWFVSPLEFRPWSVISRTSAQLFRNISSEPGPVLLEGWQCSDLLRFRALKERVIWVRSHNIESNYYRMQADSASGWIRRIYYILESLRWSMYEQSLPELLRGQQNRGILSICPLETLEWNRKRLPVHYVPAFVDLNNKFTSSGEDSIAPPEESSYALYHGRLDIDENIRAVRFLLSQVALPDRVSLVIAGSRITPSLQKDIVSADYVQLVDSPNPVLMKAWIYHADVHCIPCYGKAGLKLKIIHAMLGKGHVLVSREGVIGMSWADWVTVVDSQADWSKQLQKALNAPLTSEQILARHAWVRQHFDHRENALQMLDLMGIKL
jgi:hypothetical protein